MIIKSILGIVRVMTFTVLFLFISIFSTKAQVGMGPIGVDECCATIHFQVPALNAGWTLNTGDGTVYNQNSPEVSGAGGNFVLTHCYDENNSYQAILQLNGGGGASSFITISDCRPEECSSFICWEDFIGYFSCAQYMIVQMPDGTTQNIFFGNIPVEGNGSPNGGFDAIAEALEDAMKSLNYGGEFSELGGCSKTNEAGSNPVPGFYFSNSSILILEVCGGGPCVQGGGSVSGCVEFNHECD